MPAYVWEGKTASGEIRNGEMDAADEDEVNRRLRQQDIQPSKVKKKPTEINIELPFGGGVPTKSLVVFTRQFSTMIDAGLPLVQALDILGSAEPNKNFKKVIKQVQSDIESGTTLADAMGKHPKVFNQLYVSLVAAGEVAGILDTVMARLAMQIEKEEKLRRKIKGAFTYPAIVMFIAIAVVILMLYKVIPTFTKMFAEMGGAELPKPTQIVVAMSEFVQSNIVWIAVGIVVVIAIFRAIMSYKPTRAVFDNLILKAPVFGPLVRKSSVARFTRTLGTMVSSGVPIIDSLEIVAKTAGNMTVEKAVLYVRDKISEGQNMVDPLSETGVFPPMVVQMIGVGESTGALDNMLNKIADFYEDEVDVAVDNLTSLLEPLLMCFLGIFVGGMLIAMYLPIFQLAGNIKSE
jgi:type IV pilus assembly protein PilC